jgi:hypothetical protein
VAARRRQLACALENVIAPASGFHGHAEHAMDPLYARKRSA